MIIALIFFSFSWYSMLQCDDFLCKVCVYNQYDPSYNISLSLSFSNPPSYLASQCQNKSLIILKRKVFVYNSTNTWFQPPTGYDISYSSLATALEGESRIAYTNLISALEIILQVGTHFLLESDFQDINEQFFRRTIIDVIISSENIETSTIICKTNKFYFFISSKFQIQNLIFLGNDLNWKNFTDPCYFGKNPIFCCQETYFPIDYSTFTPNDPKLNCSIKNHPILASQKNNFYAMFNLESLADNTLNIQPNLSVYNCKFLNFFILGNDGFLSLFALAPLSGSLSIESVTIEKTFFPQGVLYYSRTSFDPLYSSFSVDSLPTNILGNLKEGVILQNVSFISYNCYPILANFDYFMFTIQNFKASFFIFQSLFSSIFSVNVVFLVNTVGVNNEILIQNVSMTNISQSSIMNTINAQNVTFSNFQIEFYQYFGSSIFNFDSVVFINIVSFSFSDFKIDFSSTCFQIKSSLVTMNNSFISQGQFNSFITQENNNLFIHNSTFTNLTFHENLISFSNFDGYSISNSIFSGINGDIYLFVLFASNYLILNETILENINTYAIFSIFDSQLNLIENCLLRNSYFYYIWEKDPTCTQVITNQSEYYNNIVAISFYRDLSIPDILFLLYRSYIYMNSFIQLNSGGMLQMQVGDCTYDQTVFMDNYFLNYNTFQYLFEFDSYAYVIVKDCFFKDNGVITKKVKYFSYTDNDVFCLWTVIYTHFNHTVFVATDKVEMLAGFISAAPHGGVFEYMNCVMIFKITNTYFEYKGIQLDHFLSATLINNTFYNLLCNRRTFANSYGGVSLLASTSYTFSRDQNNYWVIMKNNSFYNSSCPNGGGLSIVGIQSITLEDCKFYQSRTENRGGALILVGSETCNLKDIYIDDSQASQGGGLYIQTIFEMNINNLTIQNVFTQQSGSFYVKNIGVINIQNLKTFNTSTGLNGGVFLVMATNFSLNSANISNSIAKVEGGTLVCDEKSVISLNNIMISNSSANKAGVFDVILGIFFTLRNSIIQNSFSMSDGGTIIFKAYSISYLDNVTVENCFSSFGLGVIYIGSDDESSQIYFQNLHCLNVSANDGSCIFYFSSSKFQAENLTIRTAFKNPLSISGLITVKIQLANLMIRNSVSAKNILYALNIELNIFILDISDNYAFSEIFVTDTVVSQISHGIFLNNSKHELFSFLKSSILLQYIYINNKNDNVLYMTCTNSNITFIALSFSNGSSSGENAFISFTDSQLNSINCSFTDHIGLLFHFSNGLNIVIENNNFTNNKNPSINYPNEIYIENIGSSISKLFILQSSFLVFSGFSIQTSSILQTTINDTYFKNFGQNEETQAVIILSNMNVTMRHNVFTNFSESSLNILNDLSNIQSYIYLSDSGFISNKALKGSGIFLKGHLHITLVNCSFRNNLAFLSSVDKNILSGVASCIFFKPNYVDSSIIQIKSCFFENNSANFIAPTILSQNFIDIDNKTIFINNNDSNNFTKTTLSLPLDLRINKVVSENIETLFLGGKQQNVKFCSGKPFILELLVCDFSNQTLIFDNQTVLTIKKSVHQNLSITLERTVSRSLQGRVIFENLLIKVLPKTLFTLDVSGLFSGITKDFLPQEFFETFTLYARECMIGEIILHDYSCSRCPENSYSLFDPMLTEIKFQRCLPCPVNCECPGGNQITPIVGFYRYLETSIEVVECLSRLSCIGNQNTSQCDEDCWKDIRIHGGCEVGNDGPLCSLCEKFHGKYDKNSPCQPCADLGTLIICRLLGYLFLMCGYLILNSHLQEKSAKNGKRSQISVFTKIIINHIQQINIILMSGVNLPFNNIKTLFSVADYISFTNEQVVNNECLLERIYNGEANPGMLKVIINSVLPILLSMFSFFMWLTYFLTKSKGKIMKSLIMSKLSVFSVLSVFMFYPLIIKSCFGLFDCIELDSAISSRFLKVNLNLECWSNTHIGFIFLFAVPGILIWGLGFPLFLNFFLKKKRQSQFITEKINFQNKQTKSEQSMILSEKNTQDNNKSSVLSFFYKGYNESSRHWESFILGRKFLICLISTLTASIHEEFKWFVILIIFFYFLSITTKRMPFITKEANNAEIFSLVTCIFCVFACLNFNSDGGNSSKFFWAITLMIMNLNFIIYVGWFMVFEIKQNLTKMKDSLRTTQINSKSLKIMTKIKYESKIRSKQEHSWIPKK